MVDPVTSDRLACNATKFDTQPQEAAAVPAQEIDVPELLALVAVDPRWDLPAVAFLRNGSVIDLGGRSLRQAHDEVTQAGDNDIYIYNPRAMADDLRNLRILVAD
jgi:hypothetical protein